MHEYFFPFSLKTALIHVVLDANESSLFVPSDNEPRVVLAEAAQVLRSLSSGALQICAFLSLRTSLEGTDV